MSFDETQLETDPDAILQSLDDGYVDAGFEQVIEAARQQREAMIPRLIGAIEEASRRITAGEIVHEYAHLYGIYLLTEFQAREAWPAILASLSLPGNGPESLYGELLIEELQSILAFFLADSPDTLREMIDNAELYKYVRVGAAAALLLLVRDGKLTRAEAVSWLRASLTLAIETENSLLTSFLLGELEAYSPREAQLEINTAYSRNLVEPMLARKEHLVESISRGEPHFQESLSKCPPTGIADTWKLVRSWYETPDWDGPDEFEEPSMPEMVSVNPLWNSQSHFNPPNARLSPIHQNPDVSFDPATIRNDGLRVGRNDPCTCGSGKKFKKCCGKS